jgi:hypothetical protein
LSKDRPHVRYAVGGVHCAREPTLRVAYRPSSRGSRHSWTVGLRCLSHRSTSGWATAIRQRPLPCSTCPPSRAVCQHDRARRFWSPGLGRTVLWRRRSLMARNRVRARPKAVHRQRAAATPTPGNPSDPPFGLSRDRGHCSGHGVAAAQGTIAPASASAATRKLHPAPRVI